ncbi:hypothetical protein ASC77_08160 [Nocardioides sp. Root1257]|uniref:hypothetical protein n=1 Tax=unclassified Nocardioides TaxID=2615069 RepID=UPI0006F9F525|nr:MULTISPECIES: hypothetical protein [unclassified Nocardioides]KQW48701.1 hypothetical protein ASC77_08160 [Nocardioides sp. Root1257]KRC47876.1 hypothetical protein ASE24_08165 [Nocardioides sp. Root224]
MTQDLHEQLDDLVVAVPTYVVPDARAAWTTGARRRTRHRIAVGATAIAVLAVLASAVSWLPHTLDPAPADPDGAGVDGYPTRVDDPWLHRDLPSQAGALAGLVRGGNGTVGAVSPRGRVWDVPQDTGLHDFPVALSADGTKLGYLEADDRFVLRDLVTGETTVAQGVDDGSLAGSGSVGAPYAVRPGPWGYWSPDATHLFVDGGAVAEGDATGALLIDADGATTGVSGPAMRGDRRLSPAGWTSDGNLVWLAMNSDGGTAARATVVVTTTSGQEVRRVPLQLHAAKGSSPMYGYVSPAGTRIVLVGTPDVSAPVFSLADGRQVGEVVAELLQCPVSWAGESPRPAFQGSNVVAVRDGGGRPLITVDPAFGATCATWASDALSGDARRGVVGRVLGSSNAWAAWHWQEIGLGLLVLGVALLVLRRRRRRLVPTS